MVFFALFVAPYEREVLEINKKMGLSDGGAGVRSLVNVRRAHSPSFPFSLSRRASLAGYIPWEDVPRYLAAQL